MTSDDEADMLLGRLSEAEGEVERLREKIQCAIEQLEKYGNKGPKQIGRALLTLDAALGTK